MAAVRPAARAVDGRDRPDARRRPHAAQQPVLDGRPRRVVRVRGPARIARPATGEDRGGREGEGELASAQRTTIRIVSRRERATNRGRGARPSPGGASAEVRPGWCGTPRDRARTGL